ncbi:MAG: hypothetical protein JXA71_15440, partial [Chitinispirillaceae bacterium]|nr:hypothetical protein [Chitinispirillaceae bacterium]
IGIADSTSAALTTQLNVLADSDFRPSRQPGFFTLAATMPDLSNIINNRTDTSNVQPNDFADNDKDGYPDWLETALGTNKLDAASKPEMTIDSDKDGIADFFESMLNYKPEDSASKPADVNGNHIPDTLEKKTTWDTRLNKDSDNDTWPDEIEMALQTDPWNAGSFPKTFSKGSAPTGNYRGKILIQSDNKEYAIAISIGTDSLGNASAVIDSTMLNILRTGERLECRFEFGEWVFYSKMIAGLFVNKYLKFRAMPKYQELEGNIDMSDLANGGGPLVGRFRVRTDGNVPSLIGGDPNVQPGTINPPPQNILDALSNPTADAKAMTLSIAKDATSGKYTATLSIDGMQQLTSFEAHWQPQMFPRYIFKFVADSGEIRIEGDVFRDAAAMYLGGPVFINMKQSLDFVLRDSLAKIDDPTAGTWKGFVKKSTITDINNKGPLAYIGLRAALESAVTQTSKKAMKITDSTIIIIKEFWQEGIWKCKDSTGTPLYQILEKPGDPQNVFIGKDKSGADVIMIRPDGGTITPNGPVPFKGPLSEILKALTTSGLSVKVMVPNNPTPRDTRVDTATLRKIPDPGKPTDSVYQIRDLTDTAKYYSFLGDPAINGALMLMDNKPLVSEMGTGPQPQKVMVPYIGPLNAIQTALTASTNGVIVMVPNNPTPRDAQINAASLEPFTDSLKPGVTLYRARDAQDSMKQYLFMADSASGQLLIQNNKPVVSEMSTGPQPRTTIIPYSGPITGIQTALATSSNSVKVIVPNNTNPLDAQINPASLQPFTDPKKPDVTTYQARDAQDTMKMYVFMADSATGQLKLMDNKPVVSEMGGQGPMIQPFRGAITLVETALTASNNQVQLKNPMDGSTMTISVDRATLQSIPDPQALNQTLIVATRMDDAALKVLFTGMQENPAQLNIDPGTNRPVVVDPPPGTM